VQTSFSIEVVIKTNRLAAQAKSRYMALENESKNSDQDFKEFRKATIHSSSLFFSFHLDASNC